MKRDSLIDHIWLRHRYAVLARSRSLHDRIEALVSSDPPLVGEAIELMGEALASPPSRTGWTDAVDQAWGQLRRTAGCSRDHFAAACKQGREEARVFLFRAAATAGDHVLVGSSLLDDEPITSFAFYAKATEWWQVREKNGHLSSLPVTTLLNRAGASARPEAVLAGEGVLRRVGGTVYADPRFTPLLRPTGLWKDTWASVQA
jgi:hypothetical protein